MNRLTLFIGIATVAMTACNPSTQHQKDMTEPEKRVGVVEITTFKLNQGVSAKDFEQAALSMQKDFLEKQSGFVTRTLTVSPDSFWTDIVYWQDRQSAETTLQLSEKSELVVPFMEKIDFNSVKMNLSKPVLMKK